MAAHHFLPATFLAGFSTDASLPRRKRRLAQGDKQQGKCITARAERLAVITDLYTLRDPNYGADPQAIDNAWGRYEAKLAPAIRRLTEGTIDALEWAGVVTPFVASLFVRGPNFETKMDARMEAFGQSSLKSKVTVDNINYIRGMEIQRTLGPILCARWIISKIPEKGGLITTDVGFGIFEDPNGEVGIAIPLDGQHILQIIPRRIGDLAIAGDARWYPMLEHRTLLKGNYDQLNRAIARCAKRFIFGSDESLIKSLLPHTNTDISLLELGEVGFICGPLAAVHEFTWHRFVSAVSRSPSDRSETYFDLDWMAIAKAWKPPVVLFPTNLPSFPCPLYRRDRFIGVHLYDVEGFPSHEQHPEPRVAKGVRRVPEAVVTVRVVKE